VLFVECVESRVIFVSAADATSGHYAELRHWHMLTFCIVLIVVLNRWQVCSFLL